MTEMNGEQGELGAGVSGGETSGMSPLLSSSDEKLKCLRDITDTLLGLSDEEWGSLTSGMQQKTTKTGFAELCTKIVTFVSTSTVENFLPLVDTCHSTVDMEKGDMSTEGSPADQSNVKHHILGKVVNKVKTAMQGAIRKVASEKPPVSVSGKANAKFSSVLDEMLYILKDRLKHSPTEDKSEIGHEGSDVSMPELSEVSAITGKIVIVVLDIMEGNRVETLGLKETGDLLQAAAKRLKLMSSSCTSKASLNNKISSESTSHDQVKTMASRAVSEVLLSNVGVWTINEGSSRLPSSVASQLDLDIMTEAMAQSVFPTDSILSQLDSTSNEIVETIVDNINALSQSSQFSYSAEKSDHALTSGTVDESEIFSATKRMLQTVHQKVKNFFGLSKQPVKNSALGQKPGIEPLLDEKVETDDLEPFLEVDLDSCSNEVICKVLDLFKSEVLLGKSRLSDECQVGRSEGLHIAIDHSNCEEQRTSIVSSSIIDPLCTANIPFVEPERVLTKDKSSQADFDSTLDTSSVPTAGATCSENINYADVNLSETSVNALDGIDLDNLSALEDFSAVSDKIGPITLSVFKRVQSYLKAFFMSSSHEQPTTAYTVSQLDDYIIECTNDIISNIVQLYQSDISLSEHQSKKADRGSEKSLQSHPEIHSIMQGLEELVTKSRSSSRNSFKGSHLEDSKSLSVHEPVLHVKETTPSSLQSGDIFGDMFQEKAAKIVNNVPFKACQCLVSASSPVSSQTDIQAKVEEEAVNDRPSVAASVASIHVGSIASDDESDDDTGRSCGPNRPQKSSISAAQKIYRAVHKKVFGFFFRVHDSLSTESLISSHLQPANLVEFETERPSLIKLSAQSVEKDIPEKMQVDLDSLTEEVISKVVDLYKIEALFEQSTSKASQCSHSVGSEEFLIKATEMVSDVLEKRSSSQISSGASTPEGGLSSHLDLQCAAANIAEAVVNDLDRFTQSLPESKDYGVCDIESCSHNLDVENVSWIPINNVSKLEKDTVDTTDPCADLEKTNELFATAKSVQIADPKLDSPMNHLKNVVHHFAHCITHLTAKILQSDVNKLAKSRSESTIGTFEARNATMADTLQFPSAHVNLFAEEAIWHMLLYLECHSPNHAQVVEANQAFSSDLSYQDMPEFTTATKSKESISETSNVKIFYDVSSQIASRAASAVVKEVLDHFSTSSDDSLPSPGVLNSTSSLNSAPEAMKKIPGVKKKCFFTWRQKKSKKLHPLDLPSENQCSSTSGNLLETSHRESESSKSSIKKPRKLLTRIFSAISKVITEPFKSKSKS